MHLILFMFDPALLRVNSVIVKALCAVLYQLLGLPSPHILDPQGGRGVRGGRGGVKGEGGGGGQGVGVVG